MGTYLKKTVMWKTRKSRVIGNILRGQHNIRNTNGGKVKAGDSRGKK